MKIFSIALLAMVPIAIASISFAEAQAGKGAAAAASQLRSLPAGAETMCRLSWKGSFESETLGSADFVADGTARFETVSVTPDDEAAGNTQRGISLDVNVSNADIGDIHWSFSDDEATPTTIVANQIGPDFPATADIYFTPVATVSSQPGVTYKAREEVHLQNRNLTSFNPQVNERYTLASGPITFYDEETGEDVFTIDASEIIVGDGADGR